MRSSVSLRLAVVTPVVFATWFVTSSLVSSPKREAAAAIQVGNQATEVAAQDEDGQDDKDSVRPSRPVQYAYRYAITSFDVGVDRAGVYVKSSVDMIDNHGDRSYAWRLKATAEGAGEPAVDMLYDRQVFSIHPSGRMSPTFTETLKLPQGKHRVELVLYAFPTGFDLTQLADHNIATEATVVGGVKEVRVP